jgi:hypothetical protein
MLTVSKVYQPDRERITRAILRLAGITPSEIERVMLRLRESRKTHDATDAPVS